MDSPKDPPSKDPLLCPVRSSTGASSRRRRHRCCHPHGLQARAQPESCNCNWPRSVMHRIWKHEIIILTISRKRFSGLSAHAERKESSEKFGRRQFASTCSTSPV